MTCLQQSPTPTRACVEKEAERARADVRHQENKSL